MTARKRRLWPAFLLALAVLVAASGGAVVLWGRQLAEPALRAALAEAGLAVEVLEIKSLRPGGIDFGAIRLVGKDAPALEALRVNWTWALLQGRVRDIRIDGLRITARYDKNGLAIAGLDLPGGTGGGGFPFQRIELRGMALSFNAEAGSANASGDAIVTVRADGSLAGSATLAGMARTATGDAMPFSAKLPEWSFASPGGQMRFALGGATLALAAQAVELDGLSATVAQAGAGMTFTAKAGVTHTASPAAITPLALGVSGNFDKGVLAINGDGRAHGGALTLTLAARHDIGSGRGSGRIYVAPMRFQPNGLQPRDLFPLAGDALRRVGGAVTAQASATWTGGSLKPALALTFDGVGMENDLAGLAGLNAKLTFGSLAPLRTAGVQQLTARLLLPGLPEAPFDLRFALEGATLKIDRATLSIADGTLALGNVALARGGDLDTALEVDKVNIATALALVNIDGLSGTGSLSGRIPVRVDKAGFAIAGGRLVTNGPGTIKYSGTELPAALTDVPGEGGESIRLLRQALSDFRYDELSLGLDRNPAGDGTLLIGLKGANPAVLENHPFVVNIKVEANFDRLAAIFLGGYEAAGGLLRQVAGK